MVALEATLFILCLSYLLNTTLDTSTASIPGDQRKESLTMAKLANVLIFAWIAVSVGLAYFFLYKPSVTDKFESTKKIPRSRRNFTRTVNRNSIQTDKDTKSFTFGQALNSPGMNKVNVANQPTKFLSNRFGIRDDKTDKTTPRPSMDNGVTTRTTTSSSRSLVGNTKATTTLKNKLIADSLFLKTIETTTQFGQQPKEKNSSLTYNNTLKSQRTTGGKTVDFQFTPAGSRAVSSMQNQQSNNATQGKSINADQGRASKNLDVNQSLAYQQKSNSGVQRGVGQQNSNPGTRQGGVGQQSPNTGEQRGVSQRSTNIGEQQRALGQQSSKSGSQQGGVDQQSLNTGAQQRGVGQQKPSSGVQQGVGRSPNSDIQQRGVGQQRPNLGVQQNRLGQQSVDSGAQQRKVGEQSPNSGAQQRGLNQQRPNSGVQQNRAGEVNVKSGVQQHEVGQQSANSGVQQRRVDKQILNSGVRQYQQQKLQQKNQGQV